MNLSIKDFTSDSNLTKPVSNCADVGIYVKVSTFEMIYNLVFKLKSEKSRNHNPIYTPFNENLVKGRHVQTILLLITADIISCKSQTPDPVCLPIRGFLIRLCSS